jgi:hypothetical protein
MVDNRNLANGKGEEGGETLKGGFVPYAIKRKNGAI